MYGVWLGGRGHDGWGRHPADAELRASSFAVVVAVALSLHRFYAYSVRCCRRVALPTGGAGKLATPGHALKVAGDR